MFVNAISIRREGYIGRHYGRADPSKPFRTTIEVQGQSGNVELDLSPELSQRILAIIADEVAAAGRATAEAMTAEVLSVATLPAPEATA